ncbi:MAG: hypothetical protein KF764_13180 [Labilithrix sp.]|nr:hypothetical protein [Labilithrix sp.]
MGHKVLVTNVGMLERKYKAAGWKKIDAALQALVQADDKRGITTSVVALDSATAMSPYKAPIVSAVDDEKATKRGIDAIATKHPGAAIVIVGAGDVVCTQSLENPLFTGDLEDDPDETVPSDLPYASTAKYSTRILDFIRPTRVVSRVPDLVAASTTKHLLANLATAASWKSRRAVSYAKGHAVSAHVWRKATRRLVNTLFGKEAGLHLSPTAGPDWTASQLSPRLHLINCHGGEADPKFYGEDEHAQVVSHVARKLRGKFVDGTVVAAECCYGAQLYDPSIDDEGICHAYLGGGAYAFVGSTNVAYGPAEPPNGYADVLCLHFLQGIKKGMTTGEALLSARAALVAKAGKIDPVTQKTVAQFYLLGDATVRPVQGSPSKSAAVAPKGLVGARAGFDAMFATQGPVAVEKRSTRGAPAAVRSELAALTAARGLVVSTTLSFDVEALDGGDGPASLPAAAALGFAVARPKAAHRARRSASPARLHVVFAKRDGAASAPEPAKKTSSRRAPADRKLSGRVLFLVDEVDGEVRQVRELHRK